MSHCCSSLDPPAVLVWFKIENIDGAEGFSGDGNTFKLFRVLFANLMKVEEVRVSRVNFDEEVSKIKITCVFSLHLPVNTITYRGLLGNRGSN